MQYRSFGSRIKEKVSALGFGAMRLPTENEIINKSESEAMLKKAIDEGVNYIDTAWPYHGKQSEPFVGEFVSKYGLRDKVFIATKMPMWELKSADDLDRIFAQQLENLQTDYIDFYLFHALNKKSWEQLKVFNGFAWAEKMKAEGKIRYIGFSFHDDRDTFVDILNGWDGWDFTQIQLNYIDIDHQQGLEGLEMAAEKGIGVVIMEPLLGGKLCKAPDPVQKLWDTADTKRTPSDWALQWLWSKPEVSIILSGMSSMQHVEENAASAAASSIGMLSEQENQLVSAVRDTYQSMKTIGCTECNYCMPCPNNVAIPRNFKVYNEGAMYGDMKHAKGGYVWIPEDQRADKCIACGDCLDKCPQHIAIIDELEKVTAAMA